MRSARVLSAMVSAALLAISIGASAQERSQAECQAAGNSPLREPAWYAAACGWMHQAPARPAPGVGVLRVPGDPAFHVNLR